MAKFICKPDCGNAPKKILLRDFNKAVASGGLSFIEKNLADDAIWHLYEPVGQKELRGKENILGEYKNNLVIKPTEFVIESILSHGDEGAVRGTIKTRDKVFVFGDFYKFSSHAKNAKIREM